MSGDTFLPDLTNGAEIDDARYELRRAADDAALAAWARRYGEIALDALADHCAGEDGW